MKLNKIPMNEIKQDNIPYYYTTIITRSDIIMYNCYDSPLVLNIHGIQS